MADYEITVQRTYRIEAENAAAAVAGVLTRERGPDDFTLSEIERVEELVPQAPLHFTVERKDWV